MVKQYAFLSKAQAQVQGDAAPQAALPVIASHAEPFSRVTFVSRVVGTALGGFLK